MIRPSDPGDALRHEIKLVCEESSYAALRMALRLLPAGLRELHPTRRVQSIYLDTALQRALEENRAGISMREKVRFRWYGEGRELVRGTLERKRRANTLGWKETLALAESIQVEGAPRASFVAALARAAGGTWRARLERGLEPVQWIAYRRDYLATADLLLRLTIDRELTAFDQRLVPRLSSARPTRLPRFLVVEIKCAPAALAAAQELANRLPLLVGRCSKFVLASDPTHGPLDSFLER